jgi:RelA/SpoT family (p)ppGpp synthetase
VDWKDLAHHLRHISEGDRERVKRAYDLGESAHRGQKRKSGEPYFTHPVAVAGMLADMGADTDTVIAALLHDTVEDTPLTLDEIDRRVDGAARDLIDGVTKLEASDVEGKPTLNERIETLRKMFTLMQHDVRIMVIKLVDRLHNMQTIQYLSPTKQRTLAEETRDVYVKIADRLCMLKLRNELEGCALAILDPDLYARLSTLKESTAIASAAIIRSMRHKAQRDCHCELHHEPKGWSAIREQYEAGESVVTGLSSTIIAFVCNDIDACYHALGVLHQHWQRETLSFQDFINSPMINGYRGLHTTIILEDGTRVRCKIRTKEMQDYAERGIATKCFDGKSLGVTDYFPWAQHISKIARDTQNHSDGFWETLQGDILGESIVIHGPDDRTVMLPKGSTALDAVFFLFGEQALNTTSITINGQTVPFHQPLSFACSINAEFARTHLVEHQWLDHVHTGIASATIRKGLSRVPHAKKEAIGRALLEEAMRHHTRIGLHEINHEDLQVALHNLGTESIKILYEEIADGRISPQKVIHEIFPSSKRRRGSSLMLRTLWIRFPISMLAQISNLAQTFPPLIATFRRRKNIASLTARYQLSDQQTDELRSMLRTQLPSNAWMLVRTSEYQWLVVGIVFLIILWGLDPVVARVLLRGELTPFDLTALRFIAFFVASTILYISQDTFAGRKLEPIRPFRPYLLLSGVALFITSLSSYLALTHMSALHYSFYVIAGVGILSIFHAVISKNSLKHPILFTVLPCIGILAMALQDGFSMTRFLFGAASSISFVLYSALTERYQRNEGQVHARYPAFIFWVTLGAMPFALTLLQWTTLLDLPLETLLRALLFVMVFALIPYILYFECMRRISSRMLDVILPLVCLSALVGSLLTNEKIPLIAIVSAIAISIVTVIRYAFLTQRDILVAKS